MRPRSLGFLALCLLLSAYFGYHTVHGTNGVLARHSLEDHIAKLDLDLSHLKRQRRLLDRNVALMQPEQIDPDMLDEEARRLLNFARPDEIIILETAHR